MSVTVNSWESSSRELSVTIKEHKNFDAAWLVFKGSPAQIREDICATFGYESAGVTELTLVDLVAKAKGDFMAGGLVATKLGGKPVTASSAATSEPKKDGPPWRTEEEEKAAQAASTKEAEPVDPKIEHLAALERCQTVDDVKLYWAENQAAFADPELLAAYQARGKALKAADK